MAKKRKKYKYDPYPHQNFPILHDGKLFYKKDCDPMFLDFYCGKDTLNENGEVYMSDGVWIGP